MIFTPTHESVKDLTNELQHAIDVSSQANEELRVKEGIYVIGTIRLKNNTRIYLERGAVLLGSKDFSDYSSDVNLFTDAVDHLRGRALVYADGAQNISICGEGEVNGSGAFFNETNPHHLERPFLIRLLNCKGVNIEGFSIKNSPAWNVHLLNCEDINITRITITSRVNGNNDGIDIDACRRCRISDCVIDTGDDAICLKTTIDRPCSDITISNCLLSSNWATIKVGTESVGDFNNITIDSCNIYDCNGCAIKLCPVDGGSLTNLKISNIHFHDSTGPIFIANGDRLRQYQDGSVRQAGGVIENVTIEGLYGTCINAVGTIYKGEPWGNAMSAICISGTPTQRIKNLTLRDFYVKMAGGYSGAEAPTPSEMGKRYPEFHNFGILPAWGVYARHVDKLVTENINLSLCEDDSRPMYIYDDCNN